MLFALLLFSALAFLLLAPSAGQARTRPFFITKEQAYNGMLRADIPPALVIDDGDTVVFNTVMLLGGNLSPEMSFDDMLALRTEMKEKGIGVYAFTGPFHINGAEPGDTLEVRIRRIVPGKYAVTHIYPDHMNIGGLPEGFSKGFLKPLFLSQDRKTIEFAPGVTLKTRPFLGTMAVAPRPGEELPPAVPGYFAGNMDNKELVEGTTLYIPVNVRGALFMAADAHAVQGDGEVSIAAAETYFEEVELQFVVRKDLKLHYPLAESPTHWIVMGFHHDLDEAMKMAIREAISFLMREKGLSREEAFSLCSLSVDFRVTQVVDGDKGVHGMIPKSIFS
ncbi:acetamidase/formamidase [Aminivibrio pyruvatiphilus]|uniref:Acetamidase/formamidase n=1 Tax=Aminivibrio pyruvatiphilus TaxID=1005740 RepID=A0A4R8MBZ7_9BACT|nr:acetamidase/formamidase family protein [Aminivibrio pyruvatiphilus]TDY63263.1 acetamidase/formamidase [Aminivibrio pyruvatiphilus]